ncbi:hypothetical protein HYO65_gp118 [Tenacibaculum phage PTm1]|uniref:Uncharacterized protein n=2 Tax=Shirahamavirus PTm1 TaxID=2846435 RepID=A0A5S9HX86_9CAUD|nr:hypothetical protein HYO65_gp118 [Tenacibaculum phage PTm1]BBI90510.1 hypothetical protein [Tenacibaculum phage PTm1]BBI90818.1 hypothetical protein [Tenacibaculum phage PTm5]
MQPILYYIQQRHRDKAIMDISSIDGLEIRTLDEYLMRFPICKKLVYEYLKKTPVSVNISYLHNLFKNQESFDWYLSEAIQNDSVAKRVVDKIVYDPYTWDYGIRDIQNTIFDSKYLLLDIHRKRAKKCVDIYLRAQATHYSAHITKLRGFDTKQRHDEFFKKRMDITRDMFENYILKDVDLPENLYVNYMFDFIEIYDSKTRITFRHTIKYDMDNDIKLIYHLNLKGQKDSDGMVRANPTKKSTTKVRDVLKFIRRYPAIFKMLDNIDNYGNRILKYHLDLKQLKKDYESTYEQAVASLTSILEEFKGDVGYLNKYYLGMLFVHPNSVEANWFRIGNNDSLTLVKKTYYQGKDDATDNIKDWIPSFIRTQNYKCKSLDDMARYLIDLGFMNVYYLDREPEMNEYFLLSMGKIDHRYTMLFLMSTCKEGTRILEPYLNNRSQKRVIKDYESMLTTNSPVPYIKPNDEDLNKGKFMSRIEYEYKQHWQHDFKLNRNRNLTLIKKLMLDFSKKYNKVLNLDKTKQNEKN